MIADCVTLDRVIVRLRGLLPLELAYHWISYTPKLSDIDLYLGR